MSDYTIAELEARLAAARAELAAANTRITELESYWKSLIADRNRRVMKDVVPIPGDPQPAERKWWHGKGVSPPAANTDGETLSDALSAELTRQLAVVDELEAESARLRERVTELEALAAACPQELEGHACCDCPPPSEQRLMDDYRRAHDDRVKEHQIVEHLRAESARLRDALDRVTALADQYEKDADESDNYGGELFSTTATALRAAIDGPGDAETDQDNGQANTCRHLSASGVDTKSGPGKVWRCDHCGLCWIEGYSRYDTTGPDDRSDG